VRAQEAHSGRSGCNWGGRQRLQQADYIGNSCCTTAGTLRRWDGAAGRKLATAWQQQFRYWACRAELEYWICPCWLARMQAMTRDATFSVLAAMHYQTLVLTFTEQATATPCTIYREPLGIVSHGRPCMSPPLPGHRRQCLRPLGAISASWRSTCCTTYCTPYIMAAARLQDCLPCQSQRWASYGLAHPCTSPCTSHHPQASSIPVTLANKLLLNLNPCSSSAIFARATARSKPRRRDLYCQDYGTGHLPAWLTKLGRGAGGRRRHET
jgi:hypothetical protein